MKALTLPCMIIASATLFTPHTLAREINQTFDATPGDTLIVKTDVGSIDISTHSLNEISVRVTLEGKHEDEFDVEFEQTNSGLKITGTRENSVWNWTNWSRAEFEIVVPEQYNIDVDTSGGHIEIKDITGNINAETSGGHVTVEDIDGNVELDTSGGAIRVENVTGKVDGETSGGSIRLSLNAQPTQSITLDTSGGSINAYIPQSSSFDLEASTSGGRVRTEFDVDGRIKKRSIRGSVNGGGPKIELSTSGGSIHVDKI